MTIKDPPCKDCIGVAVCRRRNLNRSIEICSLLDDYVEEYSLRHIPKGIRLMQTEMLKQINKVFQWGSYNLYGPDTL